MSGEAVLFHNGSQSRETGRAASRNERDGGTASERERQTVPLLDRRGERADRVMVASCILPASLLRAAGMCTVVLKFVRFCWAEVRAFLFGGAMIGSGPVPRGQEALDWQLCLVHVTVICSRSASSPALSER